MSSVETVKSFVVILSVALIPGVVGGVLLHLSHKNNWVSKAKKYFDLRID